MKKILFTLVSIFTLTNSAFAQNFELPQEFQQSFTLNSNGEIQKKSSVGISSEAYTVKFNDAGVKVFASSTGTTAWYVGSNSCSQNKDLKCVSVYNRDSSKIQGNQMNPFASENHLGSYTLMRINPKKQSESSVIKCNSSFLKKTIRDSGDLSNCAQYTKKSCADWENELGNSPAITALEQKAEMCEQVAKDITKLRTRMKTIFQSDLKDAEKDIQNNFDAATAGDRGIGLIADVKTKEMKINPNVLIYRDIFERSNDCVKYSNIIGTDYSMKDLFSTTDSKSKSRELRSPAEKNRR